MKNFKRIVVTLIIVAICAVTGYHFSYPIKLNMVTLPVDIAAFHNRGRTIEDPSATVLFEGTGVCIGNKEYYLVEIGENLGTVTLKKGFTGRYKIKNISYGDGNFRDGVIESNGKKYLLFAGRDITSQISKISVLIDNQTYEIETPKANDRFLVYTEIDAHVDERNVNRENIAFYNSEGEDITKLYNLSGGGIQ